MLALLEVTLVKELTDKKKTIRQNLYDAYRDEAKLMSFENAIEDEIVKPPEKEIDITADYCEIFNLT